MTFQVHHFHSWIKSINKFKVFKLIYLDFIFFYTLTYTTRTGPFTCWGSKDDSLATTTSEVTKLGGWFAPVRSKRKILMTTHDLSHQNTF